MRRLVAELATARPDDVDAVLGALETAQRRRVEGLLAEYVGEVAAGGATATAIADPRPQIAGLSPWLAARLRDPPRSRRSPRTQPLSAWGAPREAGFVITLAAQAALRDCAATLSASKADTPRSGRRAWLPRWAQGLAGGGQG
ncbi:MAG: hypothetical protein ACHP84_00990 [Caulobacterales bacterium]